MPILKRLVLPRSGLKLTIYRTRGEHANHYATDAVRLQYIIAQYTTEV